MADRTLGVISVALTDLSRVEATLNTAMDQVIAARTSLTAYRDAAEGGESR